GVATLVLFGLYEQRRSRTGRHPLIRIGMFRNRSFTGGLLLIILFYGAFLPFFLVFSVYVQSGLGFTALKAGVALVPYAMGTGAGSGISIALAPRLGRSILQLGLTILILGTIIIAWVVHEWGTDLHSLQLLAPLLVAGLGFGLTVTPLVTLILSRIAAHEAGSASGALTTAQQVGSALGIAVIGALFFGLLGSHANAVTAAQVPRLKQELTSVRVDPATADHVIAAYRTCFHDRMRQSDPTAVPASCQVPRPGGHVGGLLTQAAQAAVRTDF
ncbi:MFS transporter, partial [Streptomyces sp. TRM76130]|nr:MFS transporter [Streptomyces sp. TRM76130]